MTDSNYEMTRRSDYQANLFTKILWWFSTAIPEAINDCTSDRNRAKIIGLGVIFTWLYASLAWTYFWSISIANPVIFVALGIFIGFGILTIDRMLIASISKHRKNLIAIALRVVLALFLGAFIAQPLILWMFEQDIDTEISILQDQKALEKQNEIKALFSNELTLLESRKNELLTEKNNVGESLMSAEREYLAEIDGTGGSLRYGIAGIAAEKQKALDRAIIANSGFAAANNEEINTINSRINQINEQLIQQTEEYKSNNMTAGFLIRIEALRSLFDKDDTGALKKRYLLILVILIIFELIPLISKLFLQTGSYDDKVNLKDQLETELAHSNKTKEFELKQLYNELAKQEDASLIKKVFSEVSQKRSNLIVNRMNELESSDIKSFDEFWLKIKGEILSKQEN